MRFAREPGGEHCAEAEFLICCARVSLDRTMLEKIRELLSHNLDWPYLIRTAHAHKVMPLLYQSLLASCPESVPPAVLGQLQEDFHANALRNLFLAAELIQLLDVFAAHGINTIPFKGPCLAACAYGNLALRQFGDLDLLFRKQDFPAARRVLVARGYQLALPLTPTLEAAHLQANCELPFGSKDGRIFVDVHSALSKRHFPFRLGWKQLSGRLVTTSIGGKQVPSLSPEDLLLVLCVHGAKHLWSCLGWITDVAELLRTHPKLDWDRVTAEARRLGCERMLFLGLVLASDLLAAILPEEIQRRARSDAVARSLAAHVRRNLFRDELPGAWERAFFDVRARDRLRDAVRSYLSLAITPNVADWACFPLPSSLSRIQYFLRPLRLAGKYGRKAIEWLVNKSSHISNSARN